MFGDLFKHISLRMNVEFADEAWEKGIENTNIEITNEDKEALKSLGKLLGNTDMHGQLKQINLVNSFLNEQINDAVKEKEKNAVLYKKLGVIVGLAVVIVLV